MKNRDDIRKEKVVKCDIKTRTVGIEKCPKNSTGRKYRCPECRELFNSVAKLNRHYIDNHPPLICKICNDRFNTLSTLSRPRYKHKKLDFKCNKCGKEFPFKSDHDLHMNTHHTIKSFKCAKPKCDWSYYSQGELDKHAKTHTRRTWKCPQCPYVNKDERNLKAHMRVHSRFKQYICHNCLKLFRYDTQLRRHLPGKEKPAQNQGSSLKIKRSASPSF